MLRRKRVLVIASLAIGVIVAAASVGWTRFSIPSVDALVAKRLADCKRTAKGDAVPITPEEAQTLWAAEHSGHGHWVPLSEMPECDANHARVEFTQEHDSAVGDANSRAAWIMAIFCIPFLWYFLLDRLREISAAILGRGD